MPQVRGKCQNVRITHSTFRPCKETMTVRQRVSDRPIKYFRGGHRGVHHGVNPLLEPTGIQIATLSKYNFYCLECVAISESRRLKDCCCSDVCCLSTQVIKSESKVFHLSEVQYFTIIAQTSIKTVHQTS